MTNSISTTPLVNAFCEPCWADRNLVYLGELTPRILLVKDGDGTYLLIDSNGHSDGLIFTFPFTPTSKPMSTNEEERHEFLTKLLKEESITPSPALLEEHAVLDQKFHALLRWDDQALELKFALDDQLPSINDAWWFVEQIRYSGWEQSTHGFPTFWVLAEVGQLIDYHERLFNNSPQE